MRIIALAIFVAVLTYGTAHAQTGADLFMQRLPQVLQDDDNLEMMDYSDELEMSRLVDLKCAVDNARTPQQKKKAMTAFLTAVEQTTVSASQVQCLTPDERVVANIPRPDPRFAENPPVVTLNGGSDINSVKDDFERLAQNPGAFTQQQHNEFARRAYELMAAEAFGSRPNTNVLPGNPPVVERHKSRAQQTALKNKCSGSVSLVDQNQSESIYTSRANNSGGQCIIRCKTNQQVCTVSK